MNTKKFRYILRYQIDPLFHPEERIEELIAFCVKSQIEEVMMVFLAEELSTGHATIKDLAPYTQIGKKLKAGLTEHDIALSLNPWTTLYHACRGRRLEPEQKFNLMVGETGRASSIAVCPRCPNWQDYIVEAFAYLASELKPIALWIEDDLRLGMIKKM